jgi:glycosyltransferase involved in cell wall biosynthesis
MPSISVIVPNYNHEHYLPRRIESVLAQTRADFELLILDDCSTDESRATIMGYAGDPRVRVAFNELNSGNTYLQWRMGLDLTDSDYVWIAESDDFAEPTFLERLSSKLDDDRRVGLAFCETMIVDAQETQFEPYFERWSKYVDSDYDLNLLDTEFVMEGPEYIRTFMLPFNTIPNASAVLFRRAAINAIGGPVTYMNLCGDWLTYCKILASERVAHVPDRLNYFREHPVNVRSKVRGDTLARESLLVAAWVEETLGRVPAKKRGQLRRFLAEVLLGMERRPSDSLVPLARMPAAIGRAANLDRSLVPATVSALLRQTGGNAVRTVRLK